MQRAPKIREHMRTLPSGHKIGDSTRGGAFISDGIKKITIVSSEMEALRIRGIHGYQRTALGL